MKASEGSGATIFIAGLISLCWNKQTKLHNDVVQSPIGKTTSAAFGFRINATVALADIKYANARVENAIVLVNIAEEMKIAFMIPILPEVPMQGSIYENQRTLQNRFFDVLDEV